MLHKALLLTLAIVDAKTHQQQTTTTTTTTTTTNHHTNTRHSTQPPHHHSVTRLATTKLHKASPNQRRSPHALRGGVAPATPARPDLTTPLAVAGWYLASIVYSLLNKEVLSYWNFPCVFSAVQLLVGALWAGALWLPLPPVVPGSKPRALRSPPRLVRADYQLLLPVAIFLAMGHLLSTVAPAYGTVAFTNIIKTAEPLFTCVFSAFFLGQTFSLSVYLTLIPIIFGVCLATASELTFSSISLVAGLLSNVMFASRTITAKRVMQAPLGRTLSPQNLYSVLTMMALVILVPIAFAFEGRHIVQGTAETVAVLGWPTFLRMLVNCGLSHYLYNECAFLALSSVHPVTHAVANTVKRIAVILVSIVYFGTKPTLTGTVGSAIAIGGVLLYSLAKAQSAAKA